MCTFLTELRLSQSMLSRFGLFPFGQSRCKRAPGGPIMFAEVRRRLLSAGPGRVRTVKVESESDYSVDTARTCVSLAEVKGFINRCMTRVGASEPHAAALADNLYTADYRGHFSHGLNRLDMYVRDVRSGVTARDGEPEVVRERGATAHVDGRNLLGPVVGTFCMNTAIRKARETGVGWVVAKGSNHFGIAGYYGIQASNKGLLGMSFTNTSPLQIPTRAKECVLGTNPIVLAAPAENGDSFVLDMATTTAALGKIELANVKETAIPLGWGADLRGKVTSDPAEVLQGGGQLPLGGTEETSGYKGYGLAMLVEIFCGILSGSTYGPNIRKWRDTDRIANLGQCFIAVDPDSFEPGFGARLQDLMDTCRNLTPAENNHKVLVAGDPERIHMAKCDVDGGITYHPNQIQSLNTLAESIGVERISCLK